MCASKNQDDFIFDRIRIMVATCAFGMGIDKSNVSYVIHYNMPENVETYYQEAGRAGRDGSPADCILYFSEGDVSTIRKLIEESDGDPEFKKNRYRLLEKMEDYAQTVGCLRGYILDYFGEAHADGCNCCANCMDPDFVREDRTDAAAKILDCVRSLSYPCGKTLLAALLHGDKHNNILRYGLKDNPYYGALREMPSSEIRSVIGAMVRLGILVKEEDISR